MPTQPYHLPSSGSLDISSLSRIFNNTVATYKYYWFLAILDQHVKDGKSRINMWDIIISMIANAWYPVHYFKLSFGKSDSMYKAIHGIRSLTGLPIDAGREIIQERLKTEFEKGNKDLKKELKVFSLNVPFRFLSPWIRTDSNKEMVVRSQSFEYGCLYALRPDADGGFDMNINPIWSDYLHENYQILLDFTYWNLTNFLQVRNPNVPNIPNKLIRPEIRKPLNRQRNFWNAIIEANGPIRCIYTGKELHEYEFHLDHFIPWSFVTHDLTWNLLPSDPSVNASKSDKIPNLDYYLPKLALAHHNALKVYLSLGRTGNSHLLEDFLTLGYSASELAQMDKEVFFQVYHKTFMPMAQVAENMGFETFYHSTYPVISS